MDETIKQVLMRRDGCTEAEAQERIDEAIEAAKEMIEEDPENFEIPDIICAEHFGLEPDYFDELYPHLL